MDNFYFVYVLLSEIDNNFYTGYTKNVDRVNQKAYKLAMEIF